MQATPLLLTPWWGGHTDHGMPGILHTGPQTQLYTQTHPGTKRQHTKETPLKHVKYTNKILHSSLNTTHNKTIMHNTVFHSPHNSTINLCSASTPHQKNEELLSEKNGVGIRKNVQKLKKICFLKITLKDP